MGPVVSIFFFDNSIVTMMRRSDSDTGSSYKGE